LSPRYEVDKGRAFHRGEYRVTGAHFIVRSFGPFPLTRSFCSYTAPALSTPSKASGWSGFNVCSKTCGTIWHQDQDSLRHYPYTAHGDLAAHSDLAAFALTQIKPCNRFCCPIDGNVPSWKASVRLCILAPRPVAPWEPRPATALFSPTPHVWWCNEWIAHRFRGLQQVRLSQRLKSLRMV
jgi:hypothetical protein